MEKIRNSKFELLRIVAISLIVFHHLVRYGVIEAGANWSIWMAGSLFNRIVVCILDAGGQIGVGLFFMLTGYFVNKKNTNVSGKILSVVLQCFYYAFFALVMCAVAYFTGYRFTEIGMSGFLRGIARIIFIPATGGVWWFIAAYVFLVFLSQKINSIFNNYTSKGKIKIIFVIWLFWYMAGSFGAPFFILYKAIFFYLIGAFLYGNFENKSVGKTILVSFGCPIFYVGFALLDYIAGIYCAQSSMMIPQFMEKIQSAVCVPLTCVCLFSLFSLIPDFSSRFVNRIASFSLALYLVHDASILHHFIWKKVFRVADFYYSDVFLLYVLGFFVILIVVTALLDSVRQMIQPKIMRLVLKRIEKFNINNYEREK